MELYPRWIAQANLINTVNHKTTSAHMVAGDQKLEWKIDVAPEMPKVNLKRHQLASTSDVLNILGLKRGDTVEAHVS